jgi:hypothetical protein
MIDDKITIIEGPPPTFEAVNDGWPLGVNESPNLSGISVTRLRTFNGPALIERCYHTWQQKHPMFLEYRSFEGLPQTAPIIAARAIEIQDGQMLILWVLKEAEKMGSAFPDDEGGDNED